MLPSRTFSDLLYSCRQVALLRQLVFGLTAAKFVFATTTHSPVVDDLMRRLRESFPKLLEVVPEDQKTHIKATPEVSNPVTHAANGSYSEIRVSCRFVIAVDVRYLHNVDEGFASCKNLTVHPVLNQYIACCVRQSSPRVGRVHDMCSFRPRGWG